MKFNIFKFYISFISFAQNATKPDASNEQPTTSYMTMIKMLTRLISYSTGRRRKRGMHSNNTNSEFMLEVSFSILDV